MIQALPIRTRLTLVYSALLFLALTISGVAVVTLMRYRLTARMDAALDHRLQGVESFLVRETTSATANLIPLELAEYASTQPEGHYIEVWEEGGLVLLKSDPVVSPVRTRKRSFSIYGKTYHTRASASEEPIIESVQEIGVLLLASSPALLALIGLAGYWISSRSLRPVDEMTQAARSTGTGDLSARLPVPPVRDEISRLAEAWNEMLTRIEESFARMQRFTADAAHELRTPLAALRTTAELTLRRPRDPQEYRDAIMQMGAIAERMNQLAEDLLVVARGDQVPAQPSRERVDFAVLARDIASEMMPLFEDKGVCLEISTSAARAIVNAHADSLRRVVVVLLDNALKYSAPEGRVTISLEETASGLELKVADTGCGIPQDALAHVFDRFYRADPSRDRKTGGHGLGLAIAQQIAHSHDGRIEAESVVGQGSVFRLKLPARIQSDRGLES